LRFDLLERHWTHLADPIKKSYSIIEAFFGILRARNEGGGIMKPMLRIAVFLSGNGTTLQNLLDRIAGDELHAQIVLVASNNAKAFGLVRAEGAHIPTTVVDSRFFQSREEFSKALFDACRKYDADLVCLAGFLQLVHIPDDYQGRVMNIHPALIPAFCGKGYYGLHVHEAVLASGVKITGCTVHFCDNQYDHGPIILQRVVDVFEDDTPDTLAVRVFEQECEAYPEAIWLFAEGRLRIEGRHVRILKS
jgi:phosphoribosylglycinamide formyltransferase 1